MAIRITGMYSGLDTESIINDLVSAQSVKKNSLVKAQTKLSWKQDAWKALNSKIYNFYTNVLDDMRWEASYQKKATKVSNSNVVSVIASKDAVNGVQELKVSELAKQGFLTGADLTKLDGNSGKKFTAKSTLSDLGITNAGSFSVEIDGKYTEINVDGSTTISDLVKKLGDAGLNANFDEKSQRFFVSSKKSGKEANFHLVGNNANGMEALSKLGMLTEKDMKSGAYDTWANYRDDTKTPPEYSDAYKSMFKEEIEKRANAYKKENDTLAETNKKLQEQIKELEDDRDNNTALTDDDKKVIADKITELNGQITANNTKIAENKDYFSVTDDKVSGTTKLEEDVQKEFDKKIDAAKNYAG